MTYLKIWQNRKIADWSAWGKLPYLALMISRALYFTCLLMLVMLPLAALAQTATLDAREIIVDDESGIISAIGAVEARSDGRVLSSEALTYNRDKKQLNVPGPLNLVETNGDEMSAASGIINNRLEKGSFTETRFSSPESWRMRADTAERDGSTLRLNDAVYTSCPECEDPKADPLWQLRAARITYDREGQNVFYAHPRLEVYGMPVFYLPYMAHAGPEVEKRSGFLTPNLASSNDFGAAVNVPYFFNLAQNYDLTLTPRVSEKQEPFVTGEWRHLTQNGSYQLTGYIHRPRNLLASDTSRELRGGILGDGQFRIGDWSLGFALQDASDDLFYRRYKISDTTRLTSRLSANRSFGRHFVSIEGYKFRETLNAETAATVNTIFPTLTHRYVFAQQVLGGSLLVSNRISQSGREQDVDETRASSMLDWSWRHTTRAGFVLSASNRLTLDAYDFSIAADDPSAETAREVDTLLSANRTALTIAYPLQRIGRHDRQTLSPKIQLVLAEADAGFDDIPHIGAMTRDLTRSQLFQPLTPKDEASRINLGLDHELDFMDRLSTRFFIGQSFNLSDETFSARSGFGDNRSALLSEAAIYAGPLTLTQRARFTDDAGELLRSESTMTLAFKDLDVGLSHSFYEAGQQSSGSAVLEEATGTLGWQMGQHWRLDASLRENLETEERVRANAAFTYEDECTLVTISFDRDYSRIGAIEPDTSINFTYTLKTIGD